MSSEKQNKAKQNKKQNLFLQGHNWVDFAYRPWGTLNLNFAILKPENV